MTIINKHKTVFIFLLIIVFVIIAGIFFKVPLASYLESIRSAGMAGFGLNDKKDVTVTCTPPTGYPAQPAYVNRPVRWHINATAKSAAINSYWYTPIFDGVPGVSTKFEDGEFDLPKTYSTIGKKKFKITVDKAGVAAGECAEVEVLVKVSPSIINR